MEWEHAELQDGLSEYAFGVREGSISILKPSESSGFHAVKMCLHEGIWITIYLETSGFTLHSCESAQGETTDTAALTTAEANLGRTFESIDALLNVLSPKYRKRFHEKLFAKLAEISQGENDDA
ncbi:hypothetical protein BJ742DRAFT_771057 [Cladochytrium replicatum]|nr:hypothetical protein BJ742DRAFT_771057 [Cladochytrium replicatum]